MTRALVTGSTGFTGRALLARLRAAGTDVHAVSGRRHRTVPFLDLENVEQVAACLRDVRPNVVFHLAGAMDAPDLSTTLRVNAVGGAAMRDALDAAGLDGTVLVLVGSAAEYGPLDDDDLPAREDGRTEPATPYGVAKWAQTRLCLARSTPERPVIVARPSNIVGPGMPPYLALASFARQLAEMEAGQRDPVLEVGDLDAVRDFIDVDDVADILCRLADTPAAAGQAVNVATGAPVRLGEALAVLRGRFDVDAEVRSSVGRGSSRGASKFWASTERLFGLVGAVQFTPLARSLDRLAHAERERVGGGKQGL